MSLFALVLSLTTLLPSAEAGAPVAERGPVASQVKGPNVTFVQCSAGGAIKSTFRNAANTKIWVEFAGNDGQFTWTEYARDEWSVYLADDGRGFKLQLDLRTKNVTVSGSVNGFLCAVTSSSATPQSVLPPTQVAYAGTGTGDSRLAPFGWSSDGPIDGMACVQILEAADPGTWSDNYFCSKTDIGMRWSSSGPIPDMKCVQTLEAADPHTWADNYLCLPANSYLNFTWNSAGPIANKRCIQWIEGADPHTWADNFLCW